MRWLKPFAGCLAIAILSITRAAAADKPAEFPVVPGGQTCEAAIKSYVDEYDARKKKTEPPDLEANDYGQVLNHGSYLNDCDVPRDMTIDVCVAVQNGKAVGITVKTSPDNEDVSKCISTQVASLVFPAVPRMDVARTHFAPEPNSPETSSTSGEEAPQSAAKPPPPVPPTAGCGCGSSPSGGHASLWVALVFAAMLSLRRRSSN